MSIRLQMCFEQFKDIFCFKHIVALQGFIKGKVISNCEAYSAHSRTIVITRMLAILHPHVFMLHAVN